MRWVPLLLVSLLTVAACSDDSSPDPNKKQDDPDDPKPKLPSDIAPEAWIADPAVDCPSAFQASAPLAGQNEGFDAGGQVRGLWLALPPAEFEGPRPIFVAFHGTSETGQGFHSRADLDSFANRGFIVVSPDGEGNGTVWPVWDAMHTASDPDSMNPDLAYFDALLPCVAAHYAVDKNRIYIGGHSAGGIMANYLLQRRSELLAGGIVASGVLSLTEPKEPTPLAETFALVTWGGDNDEWGGAANSDVSVPKINFVEQAALASRYYTEEPNAGQAWCRGADFGHAWLSPVNDAMIDLLLAHPKGLPGNEGVEVVASPGSGVTCSADTYEFDSGLAVICPVQTTKPGCEVACQLFADCAVENATIGPALAPQLSALGFSGPDNSDCSGCITTCESNATSAADDEVLACIVDFADSATCGPGIQGGLPAIDAINTCCVGRSDSELCLSTCATLLSNDVVTTFAPTCVDLVGG